MHKEGNSLEHRTDIELIRQALSGETEAFGELVQRYQDAVYAVALHSTGDFASAQDIAQEAFIEAYKSLPTLREPSRFPGWLHTITSRQCSLWRRKQQDTTPFDDLEEPQIQEASKTLSPDEELERKELRRIVLSAIAALPEKAGEVVTMYYIDGLSCSEIASFLSVPTSTVKGRLQMGRKQLKEELITMVEGVLKGNRPDEKFTEKVLAEIIKQTKTARERDAHDEVMKFCEQALEVLDHLEATEEHRRTRMDVLNWQSREWLWWFGKHEEAADNFRHAAQIAADIGDLEAQAKWLLMQTVAISRTGNYTAILEPLQSAKAIYGKLGDLQGQAACDAVLNLADLIPDSWERIYISHEEHTSYGNDQHILVRSAESIAYEAMPEQKPRHYALLGLVRRGFHTLRGRDLLARVAQPARILNFPIAVGDTWSGQIEKPYYGITLSMARTIEANGDTVVVPAGRFDNCLRVVTVAQEPADAGFSDDVKTYVRRILCGTRTMWFAPGVGLVKYVHYSDRSSVCSIQLIEYEVREAEENDYFPLSTGNQWKYERYEEGARIRVTEGHRVAASENDRFYISCAMYSEFLDDAAQLDYLQAYLEYEEASGNEPRARAWALANLGAVHAHLGEKEAALEAYHQADKLAAESGDAKLQFDILYGTDWSNPAEFVLERYERALKIAEEMGDLERQVLCLGMTFDCALRYQRGRWYTNALDAAKRECRVAAKLGDDSRVAGAEAAIDLAQALIADPEGKHALNGGNRSASSVEVSDKEITCLGLTGVGHLYDRPSPPIWNYRFWLDAPLLEFPIKASKTWSLSRGRDGIIERIIEADDETVSVPAGRFDGAIRARSILQLPTADEGSPQANEVYNSSRGFREGERWMWFAPGIGIVKAEHHHANGKRTIIELSSYHLVKPGDSYFPLAIGNRWHYEWRSEDGELLFRERERVVLEHEGKFYLACSGYTTNVEEHGEHKY